MRVAGIFSFNNGREVVENKYPHLLKEVYSVINSIDAEEHLTKVSKEKTMPGQMLYSPTSLNTAFKLHFFPLGWKNYRVQCEYPTEHYVDGYTPDRDTRGAFRDMDFVKEKLGVEVQFGKYSFMVYNVCAKMTIFRNLDAIDTGIEIVPVKQLASRMSSGVSYFEQFVWDLKQRGVADIDVPVLILGIAP